MNVIWCIWCGVSAVLGLAISEPWHVVGKIDPPGYPTFVGNDLYFSGPEQLRRIRSIVPASQSKNNGG